MKSSLLLVLALAALPARAAGPKIEVQGFGAPASNVKPKIARKAAYAAAVALALYELAEKAHSASNTAEEAGTKSAADFSFAKGLRVLGWVKRSQALDTDSDLKVTLPKSRLWGGEQILHVLKSALAEPEAKKISIARLKWTLARNGVKVRRVDYSDDNWATVTLAIDKAKIEKLSSKQPAPAK